MADGWISGLLKQFFLVRTNFRPVERGRVGGMEGGGWDGGRRVGWREAGGMEGGGSSKIFKSAGKPPKVARKDLTTPQGQGGI